MRRLIIIALTALVALFTLLIVGQRRTPAPSTPSGAPAAAPLTSLLGVPVILVSANASWNPTDEPIADLSGVAELRIGDAICIYNTRGVWIPCTIAFYDADQMGIAGARADLPPTGAATLDLPISDRTPAFAQITFLDGEHAFDAEGGDHQIGYGAEPLTIGALKELGFLDASVDEIENERLFETAIDIGAGAVTLIVTGRHNTYGYVMPPDPSDADANAGAIEERCAAMAHRMIDTVRAEDGAAGE